MRKGRGAGIGVLERGWARIAATLCLCMLLLPGGTVRASTGPEEPGPVPARQATTEELRSAIDTMRSVDLAKLTREQKDALGERIDSAWNLILANRSTARPLLAAALDDGITDHFFTIEGTHLYLLMEEGSAEALDRAARWLSRVDPNAQPSRFFAIVAPMASLRCEACKPAILKMLQLDDLAGYVESTGLRAGMEIGLLVTLVSDSEALMPDLVRALESDNCVVRANAAWALGMIAPRDVPARLREMAEKDQCARARVRAWNALADLDPDSLLRLLAPVTEGSAAVPPGEAAGMVDAIAAVYRPAMTPLLERLSASPDPVVSAKAASALEEFRKAWPEYEKRLRDMGTDTAEHREKIRERLERAVASGQLVFDGTIFDMTKALAPEDLDLVDRARFSVLRRLSGECLGEYRTLLGVSSMMRHPLSGREKAPAGASSGGRS